MACLDSSFFFCFLNKWAACLTFWAIVENMENALFANVKKLYDHKLYECVIPLAKLLKTVLKNDRNVATLELEYQVQLYLLASQYKEHQHREALGNFEDVIHQRRLMVRHKNACLVAIESAYPEFGDVELRRLAAECYREIGDHGLAASILLQVPVKSRTPRINLMLARLQHYGSGTQCTNKAEALLAYKEVLRECPMALQVIQALLELEVDGNEVNSLVMHAATVPGSIDWLSTWIKALAQIFDCKHLAASQTFQKLQNTTSLRCNEQLMMELGRCFYYHGNYTQAEQYFSATVISNPDNVEAIGLLAIVRGLNTGDNSADMDQLYAQVTAEPKYTPSHWFVHAQSMYDSGKFERSLSFVNQCLNSEPRHQEALLLRARLLISLERHKEAAEAYQKAQSVVPYRFEVYRGLFQSYLAQKRFKEAHDICNWTLRIFRNSPRGLTMFGCTLFHSPDPNVKKTARKFAEKALKIDPNFSAAVSLMAEICEYEGAPKTSIKLLEDHVSFFPLASLFTHLGDILRSQKEPIRALEYYYKALRKDPKCQRTLRGISLLKSSYSVLDTSALEDSSANKVNNQLTTNGLATPCGTTNLDESHSREASSSPAARSGQDGEGSVWHDVDADMADINYDGH
ncbi:anaphase-promoting complex subunit 7 [Drosophila eugracilis]|uniref:anaphase-promoting complex subunit 7 n=1 Tax=Drosophila eugracilis TaxID=29029 RepID=UPI001BDA4EB3|nr:anaphase-promoting complex subunit 7 [Drosophila eugracilis]